MMPSLLKFVPTQAPRAEACLLTLSLSSARNVSGKGMPGGHNMQEGAPVEVLAELRSFLRAR